MCTDNTGSIPSGETELDYAIWDFEAMSYTEIEVVPPFIWPEFISRASGIRMIGAIMDPTLTTVYGNVDIVTFGWGY